MQWASQTYKSHCIGCIKMNKRLKLYLFSFLIAMVLMVPFHSTKATDACVWHSWLDSEDDARSICPGICEKTFPNSSWSGTWTGHSPNCQWMSWECSACGCDLAPPCQCKAGQQIACDESRNPPGGCKSDCDCAKGRYCDEDGSCYDKNECQLDCKYNEYCDKDGACREDPNCCSKSMNIFTQCSINCGIKAMCNTQCELMYKAHASTCNNGKGGCAPAPLPPTSPSKITPIPKNKGEKDQKETEKIEKISPSATPVVPKEKAEPSELPSETPKAKEESSELPSVMPKEKEALKVKP